MAGHVAPKIWVLFQMCVKGGVAVSAFSSDFVARRKTGIETFHGKVFDVYYT